MRKKGFTLAEALITLVIIGVIAALTIPAILVNTEQHEYKSAFKKALSMLNQVIELNIALDGYGPLNTDDISSTESEDTLYHLFKRRMNVISTSEDYTLGGESNFAFFTADGMRYEFPKTIAQGAVRGGTFSDVNGHCAEYTDTTGVEDEGGVPRNKPCLVIVDVNGEKRPNPRKTPEADTGYKVPQAASTSRLLDVFPVVVTDKHAVPFGVVAQRALFRND